MDMDPNCQLGKRQAEFRKALGIFRPLLQTLVAKVWMALRIPLGFTIAGFPSHSPAHTQTECQQGTAGSNLWNQSTPKSLLRDVEFWPSSTLQETQKKPLGFSQFQEAWRTTWLLTGMMIQPKNGVLGSAFSESLHCWFALNSSLQDN